MLASDFVVLFIRIIYYFFGVVSSMKSTKSLYFHTAYATNIAYVMFLHSITAYTMFLYSTTAYTMFLHSTTAYTMFLHSTTAYTMFLHSTTAYTMFLNSTTAYAMFYTQLPHILCFTLNYRNIYVIITYIIVLITQCRSIHNSITDTIDK